MLNRYMVVLMMAMLLIAGACGSLGAQSAEELIEIYETGVENWNARNVDVMASGWTDDIVGDYVPFGLITEGKEANIAFTLSMYEAFPDIQWNTQRLLTTENFLAFEWVASGTHQGTFLDIPPTQIFSQTPHLSINDYEDGKLKRVVHYLDYITIFVQLGIMPAGELPPLVPSFTLPGPKPTGLTPAKAAEELLARFNAHDLAGFAEMVHPSIEAFIAPMGIPLDRSSLIAALELYIQGFSDIEGVITRSVDLGDGWVFLEQVYEGTNDGPFFGPATGKRAVGIRCGFLERYDSDGLLTEFRDYYDNYGLMTQLGLIPAPEPSAVSRSSWGKIKSKFR